MGRLEGLIWLMQFLCQKTTTIKCEKIQINNLSRPSTVYSVSICPQKIHIKKKMGHSMTNTDIYINTRAINANIKILDIKKHVKGFHTKEFLKNTVEI